VTRTRNFLTPNEALYQLSYAQKTLWTPTLMLISFAVAVVGLVVWWIPLNSKVNDAGRILFIAGVVFTLAELNGRHINF
jgi:hypothetical protein